MTPRPINTTSGYYENSLPRCPDCNSRHLSFDSKRGEICCGHCGLVVEESVIDESAEWRAYNKDQEESKSRSGAPKSLLQYDHYGTVIDYTNRDIFGNSLSPQKASQMFRLRTLQRRAVFQYGTERNLVFALNEIKRISSQANLPKTVKETAAILYRKILKQGLIRGRSTEALVAASLYLSCRLNEHPSSLEDIAAETRLTKKKLAKNFRLLLKNLTIKTPLTNPEGSVRKFASMLEFPNIVVTEAQNILMKAKDARIAVGKNPNSLAAAALYIAALRNSIKCSQKELSKVCQITEVTLRNRYKEFLKVLDIKVQLY